MQTSSPIQKLDHVLNFLATSHFAKTGIDLSDILEKVKPQIRDGDELLRILDKLINDNYVKATVRRVDWLPNDDGIAYYKITFSGAFQNSLGGYQQIFDISGTKVNSAEKLNVWLGRTADLISSRNKLNR